MWNVCRKLKHSVYRDFAMSGTLSLGVETAMIMSNVAVIICYPLSKGTSFELITSTNRDISFTSHLDPNTYNLPSRLYNRMTNTVLQERRDINPFAVGLIFTARLIVLRNSLNSLKCGKNYWSSFILNVFWLPSNLN